MYCLILNMKPMFSDFGIAKVLKVDSTNLTELAGTYGYVAPGYMNIALNDALDGRIPPPSLEVENKLKSIMEVAFSCLDVNPQSRPTMQIMSQLQFN
ncbi:hypothetical protein Ddye_006239 [Dipteronia dyeriana]|uniref:non-specific serine/threonine protein kinase n=1 Tax=Dipteronia dyeriana TaxID=168575 RepID=A0AAD9XI78_9ROSI|nr:hypothetical protein Ddye_006239 [Dipteronia dyeriana]